MNTIPSLGFGTFRLESDIAYQSVKSALEVGYRHIDTAQIYGNEAEVGQAIADSGIDRSELFITTKVWLDNLATEHFIKSVQESLTKLQIDQVDLLLIHWPDATNKIPLTSYLDDLAQAQKQGLTKHIGVSNFTIQHLEQTIQQLGEGAIFTNQIEVHPYLQNRQVIDYCQQHNIRVTGFMPLAVGKVMEDEVLQSIAKVHQTSVANVALAWQLQQGFITIPSSTKRTNQEANLAAFDLALTNEDMQRIARLEANERIANPDFSPEWD